MTAQRRMYDLVASAGQAGITIAEIVRRLGIPRPSVSVYGSLLARAGVLRRQSEPTPGRGHGEHATRYFATAKPYPERGGWPRYSDKSPRPPRARQRTKKPAMRTPPRPDPPPPILEDEPAPPPRTPAQRSERRVREVQQALEVAAKVNAALRERLKAAESRCDEMAERIERLLSSPRTESGQATAALDALQHELIAQVVAGVNRVKGVIHREAHRGGKFPNRLAQSSRAITLAAQGRSLRPEPK